MKAWVDEMMKEKVELQIAPLIDVVFLCSFTLWSPPP